MIISPRCLAASLGLGVIRDPDAGLKTAVTKFEYAERSRQQTSPCATADVTSSGCAGDWQLYAVEATR
jgi:hypothetical protein